MNGQEKAKLLNSESKEIEKSVNSLAYLYRTFLFKLGVDARIYDGLLDSYLKRTSVRKDSASIASDKGNLSKALLAPRISWKTFMRGIELLGVLKLKIRVDVQLPNGKWVSAETDEVELRKPTTPVNNAIELKHEYDE